MLLRRGSLMSAKSSGGGGVTETMAKWSGSNSNINYGTSVANFSGASWDGGIWVNIPSTGSRRIIIGNTDVNSPFQGWFVQVNSSNKFEFFLVTALGNASITGPTFTTNTQYFIYFGHNQSTDEIMLRINDDSELTADTSSLSPNYDDNDSLMLGIREADNGLDYNGSMANFTLLNTIGNRDELFNSGTPKQILSYSTAITNNLEIGVPLNTGASGGTEFDDLSSNSWSHTDSGVTMTGQSIDIIP